MIPKREVATRNGQTYFVTSNTLGRKPFFRHDRWSQLFINVLYTYRPSRYALHGFVLMPDHFDLLMTPCESLERAVQCVKGGFSFRAKKELDWTGDIWAAGFSDHRIRNSTDLEIHQKYILVNPVKSCLVEQAHTYPFSSANGQFELDCVPQGLKPDFVATPSGTAKAVPFQS